MAVLYRDSEIAVAAIGMVIVMMAGARLFGFAEIKLAGRKAYGVAKAMIPGTKGIDVDEIKASTYHVQGDRDWETCWEELKSYAVENNFVDMTLDLNAPWLHEAFHAKMKGTEKVRESNFVWSSSVPLVFKQRIFGKVDFSCFKDSRSHHEIITDILAITRSIEESLNEEPVAPENSDNQEPKVALSETGKGQPANESHETST